MLVGSKQLIERYKRNDIHDERSFYDVTRGYVCVCVCLSKKKKKKTPRDFSLNK